MKNIGIYCITNPSGKKYIGQSFNLEKRLFTYSKYRCKDQPLLYNSLIKYGYENHIIEIIKNCEINELNDLERYYISFYDTCNRDNGLNLTFGGRDYFKHSDEVREKMSKAQMGNKKNLGRKQSKEEISKRVAKTTGKKRTPEQNLRSSIAHKGNVLSANTKEKMSRAKKGVNNKKVIDTKSGKIFLNTIEASEFIQVKVTTLRAWLNGQNKNKSTLKYLIDAL